MVYLTSEFNFAKINKYFLLIEFSKIVWIISEVNFVKKIINSFFRFNFSRIAYTTSKINFVGKMINTFIDSNFNKSLHNF